MKTHEFLLLLREYPNKSLVFEYQKGQIVRANYHITEVKNITIDAVDCGAGKDFWKETLIQIWESPLEKGKKEYMTAFKALAILNKVDNIKPMEQEAEVKFEYGNPNFHTAQLFINDVEFLESQIVLRLGVKKTDCKAKETCGVPSGASMVEASACCTPESGCC